MAKIKPKVVAPPSRAALEGLHTGSLLARLQALRALEDCPTAPAWPSDASFQAMAPPQANLTADRDPALGPALAFKSDPGYQQALAEVKALLATREHRPRGSKLRRQQQARNRLKPAPHPEGRGTKNHRP